MTIRKQQFSEHSYMPYDFGNLSIVKLHYDKDGEYRSYTTLYVLSFGRQDYGSLLERRYLFRACREKALATLLLENGVIGLNNLLDRL